MYLFKLWFSPDICPVEGLLDHKVFLKKSAEKAEFAKIIKEIIYTVMLSFYRYYIGSVQSLSCVWLFATLWMTACQASLSITNSQSIPKLMSIESVMPSNHLVLCLPFSCPQSFPAAGYFSMSQLFTTGGQNIGASASAPFLPMNIQDWFPLGLTGLISLLSKGLSRVLPTS